MRSQGGWIALARQIEDHWIWKDDSALRVWLHLLMAANYDSSTIFWEGKERTLERGQVLTTYRRIASKALVTLKVVRRVLNGLEKGTMIGTETGTHGTIITILNYRKFNDKDFETGTDEGTDLGNKRAHEGHKKGTIITSKQENKETISLPRKEISPFALDLGTRWLAFGLQAHPYYSKKWTAQQFGLAIDEVIRKTPISEDRLEDLFYFVQNDEFWSKNARSPAGLLKKSERNNMRKIDNILSRMPEKQKSWKEIMDESDHENAGRVSGLAF